LPLVPDIVRFPVEEWLPKAPETNASINGLAGKRATGVVSVGRCLNGSSGTQF
jgi:hypothetical protein